MNILLIGNGFDLAHGLPTTYKDFLKVVEIFKQCFVSKGAFRIDEINWENIGSEIKNKIMEADKIFLSHFEQIWWNSINDNFWIDYFLKYKDKKENWIDFEKEISKVIQILDMGLMKSSNEKSIDNMENVYIKKYFAKDENYPTYTGVIEILLRDLNKLIDALEIYLIIFAETADRQERYTQILDLQVDKVLSFNYTSTYQRFYDIGEKKDYDYIHGRVRDCDSQLFNNMVLGIDEYLLDDRKNKDIDFIAFKKFYQRIHKETGCKYKDWLDEIKKENELKAKHGKTVQHNLYIFGHSLDVSDKDILKELILCENVYTSIFYHSRESFGQQIANLNKVIGQDELVRRTGGSKKTIEFVEQEDMIEYWT